MKSLDEAGDESCSTPRWEWLLFKITGSIRF
jgi:hypothetical protein